MKTALSIASLLIMSLVLCSAHAQTNLQQQAIVLKRMIERNHINPRSVDDQFSSDLLDQFIEAMDPDQLYFTQTDVDGFSKYRSVLDDELQNKGWSFFPYFINVYKKKLQHADSLIAQLTQKPFDFTVADPFSVPEGFAKNEQDLKTRWSKILKYEVLSGLSSVAEMQLKRNGQIKKEEVFRKEAEARNKVMKSFQAKVSKVLNASSGLEGYCAHEFLSTLATCFDPHTNYFDMKGMKEFETALNTEGYYFGFSLSDNENNEIVISSLMPGSSAWNCGQLNKNDVLLQIQLEGQEQATDLAISSAGEVNEMIAESKSTKVVLTVRKANGVVSSIPLQKEKVENSNQHVKSFILSGKQKIGYIYLPDFYTRWDDDGGSSCASDMANEIVKLKKDGIEGIILDLRFNGGGSMQEAIELAGIFIEDGPVCQFKTRDGKVQTLKDMNRGTIWDGPMLLMVNGQSASASELVAAVLQDYNRAIIAGSTTHGKGTAQQIVPVDTTIDLLKQNARVDLGNTDNGFIKITNGRLYRVTGKTVQGSGVQPDIVLPEVTDTNEWQESNLPFYLKPDTTKRNNYYHPLAPLPVATLKLASQMRVSSNQKFIALEELKKQNIHSSTMPPATLQWALAEKQLVEEFKAEQKQIEMAQQKTKEYTAGTHSYSKDHSSTDPVNELWLDRLMKDAYVEECYEILSDLIQNK